MSPFFNHGDKPYQLSEEEEALLLLPTDAMFTRLFKTCNSYLATSRSLGKMYAHISWANKEFSQTYLNLLCQFIQEADYYEIRKKFKVPLMQVLLLNDNDANVQLRAKIAMKHLFTQMFMTIKDKYYIFTLELVHLILYLAQNIRSVHVLVRKHKDQLYPELLESIKRDPIVAINQMQWIPNIQRNSTTLDFNRRLLTTSTEDMIRLNTMDKQNKLVELFEDKEQTEFMEIEETMLALNYQSNDEIFFFSDKYKDWIHSYVIQNISNEVIFIE